MESSLFAIWQYYDSYIDVGIWNHRKVFALCSYLILFRYEVKYVYCCSNDRIYLILLSFDIRNYAIRKWVASKNKQKKNIYFRSLFLGVRILYRLKNFWLDQEILLQTNNLYACFRVQTLGQILSKYFIYSFLSMCLYLLVLILVVIYLLILLYL